MFYLFFRKKIDNINEGKGPTKQVMTKVQFQKEDRVETTRGSQMENERWSGEWKTSADFDSVLVFPIVATSMARPSVME